MGTYITTSSCSRIGIGHVCAVGFAPEGVNIHAYTGLLINYNIMYCSTVYSTVEYAQLTFKYSATLHTLGGFVLCTCHV